MLYMDTSYTISASSQGKAREATSNNRASAICLADN